MKISMRLGLRGNCARAAAAAALLLCACAGPRTDDGARDLITSTRRDLVQLGLRLDELERRLDEQAQVDATRAYQTQQRVAAVEGRVGQVEEREQALGFVRDELDTLRGTIERLDAEGKLDKLYRERLVRLERRMGRLNAQPQSVDAIWNGYLEERAAIDALALDLHNVEPKP